MISEIIREEKIKFYEKGILSNLTFLWGREGYEQLRDNLALIIDCPNIDKCMKQPIRFMGVDNKWDRRRKGLLINVKNKKENIKGRKVKNKL